MCHVLSCANKDIIIYYTVTSLTADGVEFVISLTVNELLHCRVTYC